MADRKDDLMAAVAAHRAREEERWRRENPGKIRFYLLNAPDEPPIFSAEGQSAFESVISAIRDNGIDVGALFMVMDSVESAGGYTGEIVVLFQAVSPVLTTLLGAWLQSRAGRRLRLNFDGIEVEANNTQEIADMLQQVREFRDGK